MDILKIENNYSWFISKNEAIKTTLWKSLRFKERGYFHNVGFKMKKWDGFTDFFKKESGRFLTGLLPEVKLALKHTGAEYVIQDKRTSFDFAVQTVDESFLNDKTLNRPIVLRDYQIDYINQAIKNKRGIIPSPTGSGKSQPLDSTVYTPSGPKLMGEIQPGDEVCTPDGFSAKVISIHPQGEIDVYSVKFNNGDEVKCCGEHLWLVDSVYNGWKNQVVDTLTMRTVKCAIRNTNPVMFDSRNVTIDPYIMGALLGDGGLSAANIVLSCANEEIKSRFESRLIEGYTLKLNSRYDYRLVKRIRNKFPNVYKDEMKRYNLMGKRSHEKHIPHDYLYNSVSNRLELLRGLLDTDGYVSKTGSVYFYSSSERLRDDVKLLVESLGGICRRSEKETSYTKNGIIIKCKKSYVLCINALNSSDFFTVTYKKDRCHPATLCNRRVVKSVDLIGKKECQCILIDHQDHLYLTDNFIPTHNTNVMVGIIKALPPNTPVLILGNKKQLVEQNYDELCGWGIQNVGRFHGSKKEPSVITCATVQSAHLLEPLLPKFKVLIVDEIHEMMSKKPRQIYNKLKNASVRIGMSATAFKFGGSDKSQKYEVKGWIGPVFASKSTETGKITSKELQEQNILSSATCAFFEVEEPMIPYDIYLDAVTRGIAENDYFHDMVVKLVSKLTGRTLIIVERLEHGERLKGLIPGSVWVRGEDDVDTRKEIIERLKREEGDLVAIATSGIFNTGINVFAHNLINAAGGQADHQIIQRFGRGLRVAGDKTHLEYYDFVFKINEYLEKHSRKRIKVLEKEGHTIKVYKASEIDAWLK